MTSPERSLENRIVSEVLGSLMQRPGFEEWWLSLSNRHQVQIEDHLRALVRVELDRDLE
jgi:hypothetical protein